MQKQRTRIRKKFLECPSKNIVTEFLWPATLTDIIVANVV
ncbi:hypothetical protein J0S82_018077 [Galemys pyrenaicus]|uniref:Uncharacterized protein n=1 Tax=Galemys pyrenaicus TaxID=202257 RepID=A0A8J5ZHX1_GALPY|nr:hypothetical protein J0S82_018077 [Galemys pyrenaicus]